MNAVDLASLLCSRLCHDLMSPVGALNNGIELLADEHDPRAATRPFSEDRLRGVLPEIATAADLSLTTNGAQ